jgi:hypothetical protein
MSHIAILLLVLLFTGCAHVETKKNADNIVLGKQTQEIEMHIFPLDEWILDEALFCVDKGEARELANLMASDREAASKFYKDSWCNRAIFYAIYSAQVHETENKTYRVYQGQTEKGTIFFRVTTSKHGTGKT